MKRLLSALAVSLLSYQTGLAGPVSYATVVDSAGLSEFGKLDLGTGAFTEIGSPNAAGFGSLVSFGGSFYSLSFTTGGLLRIDPNTGAVQTVGGTSASSQVLGGTRNGFFGFDAAGNNLFGVDRTTGAQTLIGPTGIPPLSGIGSINVFNIAGDQNTLYLAYTSTNPAIPSNLYTLDTATGAATLVGPIGVDAIDVLGFASGTLYGFALDNLGRNGEDIITIDPATGVGTPTGVHIGNFQVTGLADLVPVPEPSSLLLAGLGAVVAVVCRPRRRGPLPASASQLAVG